MRVKEYIISHDLFERGFTTEGKGGMYVAVRQREAILMQHNLIKRHKVVSHDYLLQGEEQCRSVSSEFLVSISQACREELEEHYESLPAPSIATARG